ncbi:type VI secretion system transmembrane protein TssO [Chitinophaga pinensis]|uniref:Type VI secretion system transmembrane protein TssO n=1 Tax=Chitinophaga pinensis (strain ATCC 43595 / DSM 2588 / LMG 13176 / NBRC 15968 / NCIMB 11800 / UQM 2034) TaxID=485918 RepID=A0A979G7U5_CHIPD|nr:type VI secretion system transmembrane protein TssO [Chitinophaga pinensis]ACU62311.1 hypothetical protein Cpin_4877 [Chitinophaga pinensis DSM 2588]
MIKLSVKERREQFLFLGGIFLFTVSLLGFGLFHDFGDSKTISKEDLTDKLSRDAEFEELVKVQRATIDTAYRQIVNFDPAVKAVFLENDIRYSLGSIRSNYDRQAFDPRYKSFLQVSLLYNTFFFNRRELKGNINDIDNLRKTLEDCKLSTRQLKESIGTQGNH